MEEFYGLTFILSFVFILVISILIMRLLGAWMLRINIVIRELKEIKEVLIANNAFAQESSIRQKGKDELSIEDKAKLFDASNPSK